jgi:hypothetical protein
MQIALMSLFVNGQERALLEQGIAYTAFKVADVQAEYERSWRAAWCFARRRRPWG